MEKLNTFISTSLYCILNFLCLPISNHGVLTAAQILSSFVTPLQTVDTLMGSQYYMASGQVFFTSSYKVYGYQTVVIGFIPQLTLALINYSNKCFSCLQSSRMIFRFLNGTQKNKFSSELHTPERMILSNSSTMMGYQKFSGKGTKT